MRARFRILPKIRVGLILVFSALALLPASALDRSVTQLAISIAPDWDSRVGKLQLFERSGRTWKAVSPPWRVLYGKNGLGWGRGVHGDGEPGPTKRERDKRAPAGVFAIGKVYTYDPAMPEGADFPFHTITEADAWIDDSQHPQYNRHVVVDPKSPPPWFAKQRMRLNDPPHRWLVEIRHNSDPPVPGAGSAIFFHIQRGTDRASAGCTVMPKAKLLGLIRWLRAGSHPHYVLLTREAYRKNWKAWGLPSPKVVADML